MANPFDRFDAPPQATTPNFFDRFDPPAVQPVKETSAAADVAESFGSGILRGAAETVMLPITAKRAFDQGASWLYDKAESGVRSTLGMDQRSPETQQLIDRARHNSAATKIDDAIFGIQDDARAAMDDYLHQPKQQRAITLRRSANLCSQVWSPTVQGRSFRRVSPKV